jgi:hypothetical protein
LNVAIYGSALGGYLRARQIAFRPKDPAKAFGLLERSLKKAFPDLPVGFTWREALERLEETGLRVEWSEVTKALRQYEGWRYGAMVKPEEVNPEVVRLAKELSRMGRKWPRI